MKINGRLRIRTFSGWFFLLLFYSFLVFSCITSAAKAEEYYALGSGYLELKKYAEAENWFTKSKFHKSTKIASEYNLGVIAYETGRYREAASYFEQIVKLDMENITALKAAAYTCIKLDELDKAAFYYQLVLNLLPESHDEGYNYAVVLMAMGKAEEAENVLVKYNNVENPKALLVLARSLKQQNKAEAADAYNTCLLKNDNPLIRIEYASYLAEIGLTGEAEEEYRKAIDKGNFSREKIEIIEKAIDLLK